MGGRARAGPRRGARRDLPRARAGRARRADPGRPPPGAAARASRPPASTRSGRTRPTRSRRRAAGHTIVTTGTASGKSLAFNLPVLDTLASDLARARLLPLPDEGARAGPGARARASSAARFLRHAIYDGDTPREERRAIRQRSNLILTNPDMLHVGVLPNHRQLGRRARQPRLGRGGRGARVPRRVRLARGERAAAPAAAGRAPTAAEPRFVLTSATIANPHRAGRAADRRWSSQLVDRDGAPRAERQIAMWNPPLVDEKLGRRASALGEAANLLADAGASATCARSAS